MMEALWIIIPAALGIIVSVIILIIDDDSPRDRN